MQVQKQIQEKRMMENAYKESVNALKGELRTICDHNVKMAKVITEKNVLSEVGLCKKETKQLKHTFGRFFL